MRKKMKGANIGQIVKQAKAVLIFILLNQLLLKIINYL